MRFSFLKFNFDKTDKAVKDSTTKKLDFSEMVRLLSMIAVSCKKGM